MEVDILLYLLIASQCLLGNPCIFKYRFFVQGYFLVYDYLQKKGALFISAPNFWI